MDSEDVFDFVPAGITPENAYQYLWKVTANYADYDIVYVEVAADEETVINGLLEGDEDEEILSFKVQSLFTVSGD